MAKNSYAFFAIGVLVLGIILLCLFLRTTEGFATAPTVTHSIYLMMPEKGLPTLVSDAGLAVTPAIEKCTISYGKKTYTLQDYSVHAFGTNCTDKTIPRDKNGNCWYKVTIPGTAISVTTTDGKKAIGANGLLTGKQAPQAGIVVDGLSRANVGSPATANLPSIPTDKTKLANLRIDLSLA